MLVYIYTVWSFSSAHILFLLVCVSTIPRSIHWLTRSGPFSKPLCKPLFAVSYYEVLLSLYFSLSLFFLFLAKRELLKKALKCNPSAHTALHPRPAGVYEYACAEIGHAFRCSCVCACAYIVKRAIDSL